MTEQEKLFQRPTQAEAAYTPLSGDLTKACATCRWFAKDDGGYCGIIDNYPQDILPTGICNRHEVVPVAEIVEVVTEDAAAAVADAILQAADVVVGAMGKDLSISQQVEYNGDSPTIVATIEDSVGKTIQKIFTSVETPNFTTADMHQIETEVGYIAPDSNAEGVFKALVDKFKRGMKPGLSVMKGVDGKRYMLIVTSNSYQDRESETITTNALKEWVDTCWNAVEGEFATDNPLVFWHDMRVKMGDIVWSDMRGPFLVELARESDGILSQKMLDYVEAHPDEKWGASHKFAYYKAHKDADGTYHRIIKKETTVLPRSAAANALTFSGVIPMASKRDEFLNKMLGLENAAELLDKGIEPLVAELTKRGIEHKSTDEAPAGESVFGNLLADMIKAQADMDAQLEETKAAVHAAEEQKSTDQTTIAAQADQIKQLAERLEAVEKGLEARPRIASRAQETEIEPSQMTEDLKNSLKKRNVFWGTETLEG